MVAQLTEKQFQIVGFFGRSEAVFTGVGLEAIVLLAGIPTSSRFEKFFDVVRPFVEKLEAGFELVKGRECLVVLEGAWRWNLETGHCLNCWSLVTGFCCKHD